jgi:hypothetical protein
VLALVLDVQRGVLVTTHGDGLGNGGFLHWLGCGGGLAHVLPSRSRGSGRGRWLGVIVGPHGSSGCRGCGRRVDWKVWKGQNCPR